MSVDLSNGGLYAAGRLDQSGQVRIFSRQNIDSATEDHARVGRRTGDGRDGGGAKQISGVPRPCSVRDGDAVTDALASFVLIKRRLARIAEREHSGGGSREGQDRRGHPQISNDPLGHRPRVTDII